MEGLKSNNSNIDGNKLLPSNLEAEQALIGSILVNNDIIDEVSGIINHKEFYDPLHSKIYELNLFVLIMYMDYPLMGIKSLLNVNNISLSSPPESSIIS